MDNRAGQPFREAGCVIIGLGNYRNRANGLAMRRRRAAAGIPAFSVAQRHVGPE